MSTFVLVHGAWHGGWCWHKIVARLEARGHTVFAPDMPGHGIDRAPIETVTMPDIVASIGAVVDAAKEKVVLVGHSYGGAVITQTAEHHAANIRKLVYVTAFLIADGQSTFDAAAGDENDLAGRIAFAPDGATATVDPAILRQAFYARCSDEDIALARTLLVPEAVAGFQAAMAATESRFGAIPRAYIECTEDRAISLAKQRQLHSALPCAEIFTLKTDHSPFFSTPDALTDILDAL